MSALPAKARTTAPTVDAALTATLRYWPLIAPAMFALTNIFLVIVFDRWDLAFVQMVATSDLITIGFVLGIVALFLPMLLYGAGVLVDLGVHTINEARRPAVLFLSALILLATFSAAFHWRMSQYQALVILLALGLAGHILWRHQDYAKQRRWRFGLILPSVALSLFMFGGWAIAMTQIFADHGFVRERWLWRSDKVPCDSQVMWLGDKVTVIRCLAKGHDPRRFIVLARDGMVLTRDPPTRPLPK